MKIMIETRDIEVLLEHSIRYCLGRISVAPYEFQEMFDKYFEHLRKPCLKNLLKDINRCSNYGMDFDEAMWMKVKERIEKKLVGITEVSEL